MDPFSLLSDHDKSERLNTSAQTNEGRNAAASKAETGVLIVST